MHTPWTPFCSKHKNVSKTMWLYGITKTGASAFLTNNAVPFLETYWSQMITGSVKDQV